MKEKAETVPGKRKKLETQRQLARAIATQVVFSEHSLAHSACSLAPPVKTRCPLSVRQRDDTKEFSEERQRTKKGEEEGKKERKRSKARALIEKAPLHQRDNSTRALHGTVARFLCS